MAATTAKPAVSGGGGIATERSPSFSLPLRFFLFGCAGYFATMLALAGFGLETTAGTTWTPRLLALTHLFALGFILPMIMGASYQLVPVVLLAVIRDEWLGKLGFYPYALGVVLLVAGFWSWTPALLAAGGTLVAVGVGIFLLTLALSLRHGAEGGGVGGFIYASLGALTAAVAIGLVKVIGYAVPGLAVTIPNALTAHASLAVVGGASLLIYGVSYRLVPMFAVGHEKLRFAKPVLAIGGLAVGAMAVGSLASSPLAVQLGTTAAAVAAVVWACDARMLFSERTRKRLDTGLTYAVVAIAVLMAASLLSVALAWGWVSAEWSVQGAIALGLLGLVGWIGFSIIGYFHKILPFLAWYHRYSQFLGKRKVPLIKDLFDEKSAWAGFWASLAGLGIVLASVAAGVPWGVQVGGALLTVGALATARMVRECLTR